ncbi:MAG TPA: GAF domain-containing protein [Chloroflexota bacterium]|nr:GAF domain-containing protein [Chloroflexota bacterium]
MTEDLQRELVAARATVADQAVEIRQLREELAGANGAAPLRDLLQLSTVAGETIGSSSYRALLLGIIEAACRLFDAAAASVLILDHETNELVFVAATDKSVLGLRFPSHQGIAGWVAMTGEPIAVSDVRRDPRFASGFAQSTGYVPRSIMAAPLLLGDDVEGVIEVLDKNDNTSFGLDDMEMLGLFAHPIAIAVGQAQMVTNVGRMLLDTLAEVAEGRGDTGLAGLIGRALAGDAEPSEQTLALARLVHTIGRRGERARRLALDILESVARNT